eukprot:s268_g8.t1
MMKTSYCAWTLQSRKLQKQQELAADVLKQHFALAREGIPDSGRIIKTKPKDVCAGAEYLVQKGLADPNRLAIDGGSAGGYTTLGALAFRDVFKAGCSMYGIGDLSALAGDTHKFESRYLDGLVGPYPEKKDVYEERAPIRHTDQLSCPILLLQGAEETFSGHGFRRSENIENALNSELAFYGKVFGFQPSAGKDLELPELEVVNLP